MFKGPAHHLLDFCSGLIRTFLPQQVPNKTKEQCHITQSAHAHTLLKRSNDSDTPLNTPMCVSASTIQSTGRVEKKKSSTWIKPKFVPGNQCTWSEDRAVLPPPAWKMKNTCGTNPPCSVYNFTNILFIFLYFSLLIGQHLIQITCVMS